MDTLAAMKVFVAIVDHGSLTAAADHLDRSQPAVVRALAALEAKLGARLLQRTTRRMSLTPEGREYLERCRQIVSDVEEAERSVSQDESNLTGPIRVTAPVQFGQLHVAPLLARFLSQHPNTTTDLMLLDRNVDLVEEGIDVALRIGPLADSDLIALPVGELRRVVCGAPSLVDRVGEPSSPHDLTQLPCIRQKILARASTWAFKDGLSKLNVKVNGRFNCNTIASAVTACVHGAGFGQFLSYQVQNELRDGRLQRVLKAYEVLAIPVHVVYPGGRLTTARQRAMANFLKTELKERVFFPDR